MADIILLKKQGWIALHFNYFSDLMLFKFQILFAYSEIALSDANIPEAAIFLKDI